MAVIEDDPGWGADSTHDLADVMSRTARRLQEEHGDVEGTLQAITATAVKVVPHAEECSISYVIGRSRIEPRASTSDLPPEVDALQERIGQGPCLDAVWEQEIVRSTTWRLTIAGRSSRGRHPNWASAACWASSCSSRGTSSGG